MTNEFGNLGSSQSGQDAASNENRFLSLNLPASLPCRAQTRGLIETLLVGKGSLHFDVYLEHIIHLKHLIANVAEERLCTCLSEDVPLSALPPELACFEDDPTGKLFYQVLDDWCDSLLQEGGIHSIDLRSKLIGASNFEKAYLDLPLEGRTTVILINLTKEAEPLQTGLEPLGSETIAGHLLEHFGASVSVLLYDTQIDDLEQIIWDAVNLKPDIVGFSVNIGTLPGSTRISQAFRNTESLPIFVFGARGAEFYPLYIDPPRGTSSFIVPGDGEIGMEHIVAFQKSQKELHEIQNITHHREAGDSDWKVAKWSRVVTPDLSTAAPPLRRNLERYKKFHGTTIELVRGCSYGACFFCPRPEGSRYTRGFSVGMKLDEISYLSAKGITGIPIIDEEFWEGAAGIKGKIPFLYELIERKQSGSINPSMVFCADMRADTICAAKDLETQLPKDEWPLHLLSQAGIKFIFCGIESLSDDMLRHLNKGTTVDENIRAVQILREKGLKFQAGSLGLAPLMELDWLEESVQRIRQIDLAELADPSLSMILFGNSPYYRTHFMRNTDKAKINRTLLEIKSSDAIPHLDSLSGIPYKYSDERVGIVARVHDFHQFEMYPVMKRLRAIHAQLVYSGHGNSTIAEEFWSLLKYGRMEIILWGMEELLHAVRQTGWEKAAGEKVQQTFAQMRQRKESMYQVLDEILQRESVRHAASDIEAIVMPEALQAVIANDYKPSIF